MGPSCGSSATNRKQGLCQYLLSSPPFKTPAQNQITPTSKPIQHLDLIHILHRRTQSPMHSKHRVFNDAGQVEVVKQVGKVGPDRR